MLAREQKKSLIDQYGTHPTDTGSPEVQIASVERAHWSIDGPLQNAPEGPRLAPRSSHAGQQASPLARLPQDNTIPSVTRRLFIRLGLRK